MLCTKQGVRAAAWDHLEHTVGNGQAVLVHS